MKKINRRKKGEKGLSLFEVFVMIAGTICFAAFVGNDFGFVSANANPAGGVDSTACSKDNPYFIYAGRTYQINSNTMVTGPSYDKSGNLVNANQIYEKRSDGWYWQGTSTKVNPAEEGTWITSLETCLSKWTSSVQASTSSSSTSPAEGDDLSKTIQDISNALNVKKQLQEATNTPKPTDATKGAETGLDKMKDATAAATTTSPFLAPTKGAELLGSQVLGSLWQIAANAGIAVGLYFVTREVANLLGANPQFADQLALSLAIGYGIGAVVSIIASAAGATAGTVLTSGIATGVLGVTIPYLGLIIAAIAALGCIFIWCREAKYVAVAYECQPWQPPTGGDYCSRCNTGDYPCTEYQCQSLGQDCELVNKGTDSELCVWNNRNDISPPIIEAWDGALLAGYEYTPDLARLPPDRGVIVTYTGTADGCAPAYARLAFGVTLDKLGKCKYDINVRKDSYSEMSFVTSTGYSKQNHTMYSILASEDISQIVGGTYETYVRCQSRNGIANEGTFVFKYCINNEPDTTAPTILRADPLNGWPIAYGQESININIYVDKPSECRWSHTDVDFDSMTEMFSVAYEPDDNMVFRASATLSGLNDEVNNNFYFRCRSYPDLSVAPPNSQQTPMTESYNYILVGTRPLVIDSTGPSGIISDSTDSIKVTLTALTSAGYKDGEAKCYYSSEQNPQPGDYVLFADTGKHEHFQDLWLDPGTYSYSIRCCDLGGNCDVSSAEFETFSDAESPLIARVFNEAGKLKLITHETAECVYDITSCSYNFEEGNKMITADNLAHTTDWNTKTNFYIKCKDAFGNLPSPNQCNIVVRPSEF